MKIPSPSIPLSPLIAAAIVATVMTLQACHRAPRDTNEARADAQAVVPEAPPPEVTDLIDAVSRNDALRFASAVSYPLTRPYPLRDVDDSVKMAIYYPVMVDDSLRNVLRRSRAREWSNNGWRGWTLADGRYLWIDEKLYELNYVSSAERAMIVTLSNEEMASLLPEMRDGWRPVFCLHGLDNGSLYRVDALADAPDPEASPTDAPPAGEGPFRLSIYHRGADLHGHPAASMRGRLETEGSSGIRTYFFEGRDGSRAYYVYDRVSDDEPLQIVMITSAGDSTAHRVERAYWRDFLTIRPDTLTKP